MKFNFIAILFLFVQNTLLAQTSGSLIEIGKRYSIHSEILNEERYYSVCLPESYVTNPNKKYIVAYVLDGERNKFIEFAGIAQSMNSAFNLKVQTPELIIVSIENTDRTRDFTPTHSLNYLDREDITAFESSGKADNFKMFIEKELIPEIDKSFRTIRKNMIVGHSLGGLFALHCFLESPELFSYYLLIDPSWFWDHNYIGKRAKEVLNKRTDLKARIYIALANNLEDDKRHYQWGKEFYKLLEKNQSPGLETRFRYFEDEKHLTIPTPATYYGLKFIFEPYEINLNEICKDPNVIYAHEKRVSEKLGVEMKLDESFINVVGYVALYDRKLPEVAIAVFEINTRYYPESLNVWDSLADGYLALANTEKAKQCYEKILLLSPDNAAAKKKLTDLNNGNSKK
jgi:predicted alpha/beta superfamily hydrolase